MAKFKIEFELTKTERILFSDYDSELNNNNTITFNESLSEEINDQYSLSFSVPEKLSNGVEVKNLISIGRPLWLHLYNPNKSIRMIIVSFDIQIGTETSIYNIEAKDYASHTFSRNNAGLVLDTFSDEDFWDWMDNVIESEDTTITNIGNYILERGWLRKREYSIGVGWVFNGWEIISNDKTYTENQEVKFYRYNISVFDSNTYNALIELCNITESIIRIDYINEKIYFISKDDSVQLDRNYTLKENFNIQDFGISYEGENLYSIFYVDGGTNIDDIYITLSQITEYKDNFLFNLTYYKNKGLITSNQYNTIYDKINIDLKNLNTDLEREIERKNNLTKTINDFKVEIDSYSDALILQPKDKYLENYDKLKNIFQSVSDVPVEAEYKETTRDFYINTISLPINKNGYSFKFPLRIKYSDKIYTLTNNIDENVFTYGSDDFTFLFNTVDPDFNEYSYNGIVYYIKGENFDNLLFSILNITANYTSTIVYNTLDYNFPFLSALYEYDGADRIELEYQEILSKIQNVKNIWEEDNNRVLVLEAIPIEQRTDYEKSELDGLKNKISEYKNFIGDYNPLSGVLNETVPGKFIIIKKIFENSRSLFISNPNFNMSKLGIPSMVIYRALLNEKRNFWYELKNTYGQHIFYEGYYSNNVDTEIQSLFEQATAVFKEHQTPIENFSITKIDVSDLIGVDIQKIQVGDYVKIEKEKLEINSSEFNKLQVNSISRILREDANIQISIYRYNMINKIVEQLIAERNRSLGG